MEQIGKRPPSKSSVPPKPEDINDDESDALPINSINEKSGVPHLDLPNPHPMNHMTISSTDQRLPRSRPQTPEHDFSMPHTPHLVPVTPPRIISPHSLEAYFLERKRRGVSGGAVIPRIVTPTPGAKGKGFKSSPLSPVERDTTDGVNNKGTDNLIREEDGSAPASEAAVDDNKLN